MCSIISTIDQPMLLQNHSILKSKALGHKCGGVADMPFFMYRMVKIFG